MRGSRLAELLEIAADAIETVEARTDREWTEQRSLADLLRDAAACATRKGPMQLDLEVTLHRTSRIKPLVATRPRRRASWSTET